MPSTVSMASVPVIWLVKSCGILCRRNEKVLMDPRVRIALRFIDQKYTTALSLSYLAERVGLRPTRLEQLFRDTVGMTPKQYQKHLRIEEAKKRLIDVRHSVKQVAYLVGYKSVPHFCNDFKRATGLTPTTFRASALEDERMW